MNGSKCFTFSLIIFLLVNQSLSGQERQFSDIISFDGYAKYLNTLFIPPGDTNVITDNLIHNRLNLEWFINDKFSFNVSARNRLFWGELVKITPGFGNLVENDAGFMDLSFNWFEKNGMVMNTIFDRLNLTYQAEDLEVIIGRHRINWGVNLVWNPNDIFNSYSFFDFDYEERPGTDAVLVRYYTSPTDNIDMVYELGDSIQASSIAGYYKMNYSTYDLQIFGGYQNQFVVSGIGWAGDINGAGFRGEGTLFSPSGNLSGSSQFVGAIDLDYTFTSSIYIHLSYLYNSDGINASEGNYFAFFLNRNLTAQTLSPAMHNIFAEISYQFSPIIQGMLANMINPSDGSAFIGPSVSWSVVENFDFLATSQIFLGKDRTLFGDSGTIIFMRFKYSF